MVFTKGKVRILDRVYPEGTRRVAARYAALYDEGWVGGYWGSAGSGFLFTTGERILLLKRASWVDQPGTWGIPGGAIPLDNSGSPVSPLASALREVQEEMGSVPAHRMAGKFVFRDGSFTFTTFIAKVGEEFTPRLNGESSAYEWVDREGLSALPLHFGIKKLLASKDPFS